MTGDECAKLADHFLAVMTEESSKPEGSEQEEWAGMYNAGVAEICINQGTRAELACGMAASGSEAIMACLEPAFEKARRATPGRLTPSECTQVVDRVFAQPGAEPPTDAEKTALHADCMKRVSRNRYACIVAAQAPAALEQCVPEGTWK